MFKNSNWGIMLFENSAWLNTKLQCQSLSLKKLCLMRNSIRSFQAMLGRMQILVTHTWFCNYDFSIYYIQDFEEKCLKISELLLSYF